MEKSKEPLVVIHPIAPGRGVAMSLAYEKDPVCKGRAQFATDFSRGRTGDFPTAVRGSNERSGTEATSEPPMFPPILQSIDPMTPTRGSIIQPAFLMLPRSMTIEKLLPLLLVHESPKTREHAAKKLAEMSAVEEHRSTIIHSSQAMVDIIRLLSVDNCCSFYAAVVLGNLAAFEGNMPSFKKFPDTLTGLVRLLFRYDDPVARKAAATGLANLSLWREGRKMIEDTSKSIKGLLELASVPQNESSQYCGQEEAKSALLALALSEENTEDEDCPISLAALAGCFQEEGDQGTRARVLQVEKVVKALENMSQNRENAKKIVKSNEFPLFLAVVVQVLRNRNPGSSSMEPGYGHGLAVRKMAARAVANLSITEEGQRMVAAFPNALRGLCISLQTQDGDGSNLSFELRECAAEALGHLALAKENRAKIVGFGTDALAGLATLLFEDDNPRGQESAARALANLSHDPDDSAVDIVVKIAAGGTVVSGLARLLQLPTNGSPSRIGAQEQSVRALANLSYPLANQVQIAQVPDAVSALAAALLSRRCEQKLSPRCLENAAKALRNLSRSRENFRSSEVFGNAFRALVDLVSPSNVEATRNARRYGALALGNFALASFHHRPIVESQHAMKGLVRMLFSRDADSLGKEAAVWALANLAHGDMSIKSTIARFPFAIIGLEGLLSNQESLELQNKARRVLADLRDVRAVDPSVLRTISVPGAPVDRAVFAHLQPVSEILVARPPVDRAMFAHLRPILQRSPRIGRRGEESI